MRLFELLQQPYPWQITSHDDEGMRAEFASKAGPGIVRLENLFFEDDDEEPLWCLAFRINGSYEITGTGDAFRVFATVLEISKKMVETERPSKFYFSAWTHNHSRVKLYRRLAAMVSTGTNYDLEIVEDRSDIKFVFTRRGAQ